MSGTPTIEFRAGELTPAERSAVKTGFSEHSDALGAPDYQKSRVNWLAHDGSGDLGAVLTVEILWDWAYVDELWVRPDLRGAGLGRRLMEHVEAYAKSDGLQGIWLWTQSWQADGFYRRLGFAEFSRFDDFPKGYARIGFRKVFG